MNSPEPQGQITPGSLRLTKMTDIPAAADLLFAMNLAKNNPRNIVEMPWQSLNTRKEYTLRVTCALSLEAPRWMLHTQLNADGEMVIWNYDTPDYQFIYNLISAECQRVNLGPAVASQETSYNGQNNESSTIDRVNGLVPPILAADPVAEPIAGIVRNPMPAETNSSAGVPPGMTAGVPAQPPLPLGTNSSLTSALPSVAFGAAAASIAKPPLPASTAMLSESAAPAIQALDTNSTENPKINPLNYPSNPTRTGDMPAAQISLPEAASVKNPAERLLEKATSNPDPPTVQSAKVLPEPVPFDRQAVDNVFKLLTNSDLGFLSHGALMFFTVREFSRFQRSNVPFSIVLFELAIQNGVNWQNMPVPLVKDVAKQLFGVMRPLDLIAHYENQDYAMLLPHTTREDSLTMMQRLHGMLNSTSVAPGLAPGQAQIFSGIATVPDDCTHPGIAIAAALEAKAQAKARGHFLLRYSDI